MPLDSTRFQRLHPRRSRTCGRFSFPSSTTSSQTSVAVAGIVIHMNLLLVSSCPDKSGAFHKDARRNHHCFDVRLWLRKFNSTCIAKSRSCCLLTCSLREKRFCNSMGIWPSVEPWIGDPDVIDKSHWDTQWKRGDEEQAKALGASREVHNGSGMVLVGS